MKYLNLLLCILFAISAGLQFNDPDPVFWIALYAGMAVIAGMAAFKRYFPWLILLGLAVTAYELFRLGPAFWAWVSDGMPSIAGSMKAESPHVELVREFIGILICFVVLILYYFVSRRQRFAPQADK